MKDLGSIYRVTKLKDMDSAALVFAILHEIDADRVDRTQLDNAMELATAAHLSQKRIGRVAYPVDPYIVHPLRNVLRLIRLGCADTDVLSATALHDTVEDQPREIVSILDESQLSDGPNQQAALDLISEHLSPETSRLVAAVTNPSADAVLSKAEKNAAYAAHVAEVIKDPKVFLIKFADFVDNAGSVEYLEDEAKRAKLAAKYTPVVEVFVAASRVNRGLLGLHTSGLDAVDARLSALPTSLAAS
ncbi:HD domain-containing protein [Rhodococcus fascians]|nr:HD domain-containing protein [Rhodococcus fascians]MBY4140240.1 HD domain-containing protein [Rhodococcus fascians]MBY4218905.1 HD domain-containing protein [Rhodococcus fascians]MBY4223831.1 HD domain-containing protein [Rhodococcus fascians]MBY4234266.1 HD domain-containing protein [Rhodococcus fascians]